MGATASTCSSEASAVRSLGPSARRTASGSQLPRPLSHEHGAPVRLVAPGRRGFQWVTWVVRIEVHAEGDPGAPASTVWSSLTRAGRGEA